MDNFFNEFLKNIKPEKKIVICNCGKKIRVTIGKKNKCPHCGLIKKY